MAPVGHELVARLLNAACGRRSGAGALPRQPVVGSTLHRHPFSGLVDSAGELLHTP